MEGAFVPRHHHSSTHLKCKTAVLTDWQTWLERIQHCFTHCIVQDISNVINSKTAVKIETILKHSPANTSHYKLGLAINKTATAITNIFNHNCFPLCLDTQATRSRVFGLLQTYTSTMRKTCVCSSSTDSKHHTENLKAQKSCGIP